MRIPATDQQRQRKEAVEILERLRTQPGVILADEVGMGKTFVALAVAYSVAVQSPRGAVIIMVPPNLVAKWEQDLKTFCELYLENKRPVRKDGLSAPALRDASVLRYAVAQHSVELMRLLDDGRRDRVHLIFLAQGAMARSQNDKWIRLALIAEALRTHGRGRAARLIQVKEQIHRFLGELLKAVGAQRAHDLGEDMWRKLLKTDPAHWKSLYNESVADPAKWLQDDPVPKSVARALYKVSLKELASALEKMPIRAKGGDDRLSERLSDARRALRTIEDELWKKVLAEARMRSPLLLMDEAHHLKNPETSLARQFKVADFERDLRMGDGALSNAFDRMVFLTATPFQLGHRELVQVLTRFSDVRWDEASLGPATKFQERLTGLEKALDDSQRSAIALQRSWSRLGPEDCDADVNGWWRRIRNAQKDALTTRQRAVVDAYELASSNRQVAENALRPWVVRHNKGAVWAGTSIPRRARHEGAAIALANANVSPGLPVPPAQLLPFFLAARSAADRGSELLGEALCSSYEAFRLTREQRALGKDNEGDAPAIQDTTLAQSGWYLGEFDRALKRTNGATHPKLHATVQRVADLWEQGEKVLVFAFYRQTCRALRNHISDELERRLIAIAAKRLSTGGPSVTEADVQAAVASAQNRFFDDSDSPGRRALDSALADVIASHTTSLDAAEVMEAQRALILSVMRRFLRVTTTIVRSFPIGESVERHADAVVRLLEHTDGSGRSWRQKFDTFIEFLAKECSSEERANYLQAADEIQTGGIRVRDEEERDDESPRGSVKLANVQVATGRTKRDARSRLMRAFNTPFFPDILVCSEVMGEGVDLQRFCRHVIHHDLAWNPSTIEQRTGRIDRLGCKAEGRHPIEIYLPYLAGTSDERQFKVMSHREQWFKVVMGQEEVAKLITPESTLSFPLPVAVAEGLSFRLEVES
jgi:hypothetical protein